MTIPVGTVIAYAGTNYVDLPQQGWMLCDGSALSRTAYADLFTAIGTANGSTDDSTFNLPDYSGYFHRGTDYGAGRDPNASAREAPRVGANSGDKVGSSQSYATAQPKSGDFKVKVPNLPTDNVKGNYGSLLGKHYALWNDSTPSFTMGGGDAETRPINKYVFFLICVQSKSSDGSPVALPVGSVLGFTSTQNDSLFDNWLLCDGNQYSNIGVYKQLFQAIGTAHGGQGQPFFLAPDYQGYFLRGVANGSLTDPDRNSRTAPAPGGNSGDRVGSFQEDATALPVAGLKVGVSHIPTNDQKVDNISGRSAARSTDSRKTASATGGDSETRPQNVTIDWYIKFR